MSVLVAALFIGLFTTMSGAAHAESAQDAIESDSSIGWVPPIPGEPLATPYGKEGPWWTWKGYHTGDDYEAATGTTINAAGSGTVTSAGWLGSAYGNGVVIAHGKGVETFYAHMSTVRAEQGDKVTMGDPIGEVGATGNVTGPHLHFEMRRHGEPFRPFEATHGGPRGASADLGCSANVLA